MMPSLAAHLTIGFMLKVTGGACSSHVGLIKFYPKLWYVHTASLLRPNTCRPQFAAREKEGVSGGGGGVTRWVSLPI